MSCSHLEALVRREWKSRCDRVMKGLGSPVASDCVGVNGFATELVNSEESTPPKKKQGGDRLLSCPPLCKHNTSQPSDILIEIKV